MKKGDIVTFGKGAERRFGMIKVYNKETKVLTLHCTANPDTFEMDYNELQVQLPTRGLMYVVDVPLCKKFYDTMRADEYVFVPKDNRIYSNKNHVLNKSEMNDLYRTMYEYCETPLTL